MIHRIDFANKPLVAYLTKLVRFRSAPFGGSNSFPMSLIGPLAAGRDRLFSGRSVTHGSVTLNSLEYDWHHQIWAIYRGRIWDASACFWQ